MRFKYIARVPQIDYCIRAANVTLNFFKTSNSNHSTELPCRHPGSRVELNQHTQPTNNRQSMPSFFHQSNRPWIHRLILISIQPSIHPSLPPSIRPSILSGIYDCLPILLPSWKPPILYPEMTSMVNWTIFTYYSPTLRSVHFTTIHSILTWIQISLWLRPCFLHSSQLFFFPSFHPIFDPTIQLSIN